MYVISAVLCVYVPLSVCGMGGNVFVEHGMGCTCYVLRMLLCASVLLYICVGMCVCCYYSQYHIVTIILNTITNTIIDTIIDYYQYYYK